VFGSSACFHATLKLLYISLSDSIFQREGGESGQSKKTNRVELNLNLKFHSFGIQNLILFSLVKNIYSTRLHWSVSNVFWKKAAASFSRPTLLHD